jgi:hypothetical protein
MWAYTTTGCAGWGGACLIWHCFHSFFIVFPLYCISTSMIFANRILRSCGGCYEANTLTHDYTCLDWTWLWDFVMRHQKVCGTMPFSLSFLFPSSPSFPFSSERVCLIQCVGFCCSIYLYRLLYLSLLVIKSVLLGIVLAGHLAESTYDLTF